MAAFDPNTGEPRRRGSRSDAIWNILTVLILISACGLLFLFLQIFQNPYMPINPFQPPTLPAVLQLPTHTPTAPRLPATYTPTITLTPTQTNTPEPPTATPLPTQTLVGMGMLNTLAPTADSGANYSFALQSDPTAIDAVVLYPERGCNWLGVGGQVTDLQGRPVTGITVQLGGNLEGKTIDQTSLTGLATKYGEAGYEFELAQLPAESKNSLWVRLIDQSRLPLSPRVYFSTFADCSKNLIIVNFRQVK